MIFAPDHPAHFVIDFAKRSRIGQLELSIYRYEPQSVRDTRTIFLLSVSHAESELQRAMQELRSGEELAIHSRVFLDQGVIAHMPLLDFSGGRESSCSAAVADVAREFGINHFATFSSGRSFHFYGFTLLKHDDWVRFMGRSLLLNEPHRTECVDSRWVGHRLMAGYASLRWTMNSQQYRAIPTLVQDRRGGQIIEFPGMDIRQILGGVQ